MNILLTGGSGFLGKVISNTLASHKIITLGRNKINDVICDLSSEIPSLSSVEVVIHAAGKAHAVPQTQGDKEFFFKVNVNGTINLLEGLGKLPSLPKSFIFISSVAVYGVENGNSLDESTPLLAKDPYGLSKIKAEKIVKEWCDRNDVVCNILRLPLIAGKNPPGNLGAMIKGITKGYYFNIAGGKTRKSIVLARDVAAIMPAASRIGGIYNLTDGYHPSFSELSFTIAHQLGKRKPISIPLSLASILAKVGDLFGTNAPITTAKLKKISADLTFDDTLARRNLSWNPTPILRGFKI